MTKKSPIAIFSLYSLLTLILTHPLIFNLTNAVPNDIGDPLLNTWILAWVSHALLTNPLNLFNANIFYPLPGALAYSEHLFSTALLALPFQLATAEPIAAYNLSLLLTFPLAAFGMYLLALRWTGQRDAAFIAGLIFAFAPYRFAAIAHLQLLTFQWLPFALLFLDFMLTPHPSRFAHRSSLRHILALILSLLLQILASWYLAVYTALILGVYLLPAQRLTRPAVARVALAAVVVLFLTLPFALPYLPLLNDLRAARPLSLALSLAAAPTDYLAAAPFNRIFGPLTEPLRARPGFTEENTLFAGLVAPVLAALTILFLLSRYVVPTAYSVNSSKESKRRIAAHHSSLILLLSLALTFALPYTLVATLFPPSTIIRVPARWIIPALFALAVLSAFGFSIINAKIINRYSQFVTRHSIFVICLAIVLLETFSAPIPLAPVENRTQLNPAYHWLANQPANFALIELPLHSAPAPEFPEVKRLYASTLGWWPLVNGYSGYTPPRQMALAQNIANFPNPQSIQALQNLAATIQNPKLYLLVHPGEVPLDRSQWETIDRWRAERNPSLTPLGQFEGDYLYRVMPATADRFPTDPVATFGPNQSIQLLATNYQSPITNYPPPNPHLTLYWQSTAPLPIDYTVFIHLRATDGFVRSQADSPPVSNHYPASRWQPGEIIQDIHPLPHDDFSQVDHLAVGLYNPATGQRLPAFDSAGNRLPDDALIIPLQP